MNWISAETVSKSFGIKWLFRDISFGVAEGDRIGLIGINGSGKSTLLKVMAGLDTPDTGNVSRRRNLRIGYLGQQPKFDEAASVYDNVFAAEHETLRLIRSYETLMAMPEGHRPADYDLNLSLAIDAMNEAEAWSYEQQIHEILSRLGMGELHERPVSQLSGGQRKRVAMARLLIEDPEILVLDEPTNHLDLETIEWLEETISNQFKTILLVTHDRYFLDRVANRIVELEGGKLYPYKGNYAYFLEKKAEREAMLGAEQERASNLMRRELEWVRRQPKARGTKAKYRMDAFEEIKEKATSRRPQDQMELSVKLTRQGGKILDVKRIRKAYGEQLLIADFTHSFMKGEKVGIIGKNGAGKSTFLNVLMGNIPFDRGAIEVGENTVFGYYSQEDAVFRDNQRVIEAVSEIADNIEMADGTKLTPMQLLQRFMFSPAMHQSLVESLSGGERKRLQLLRVLMRNPNFLVLDEPTNDLDIGTLNVLEEFLDNYPGTVMIVSHDRYFMDRLVDHLFVFEGEGVISDFPGNYTDWRESLRTKKTGQDIPAGPTLIPVAAPVVAAPATPSVPATPAAPKRKLSFNEQREFTQLGEAIPALEAERTALEAELASVGSDHTRLLAITARLAALRDELDEKELRWLELSEL